MPVKTESWSSTPGFLMATVGAAVGLGNLWRFPYIAGSNGGSAFVLVYVGWVLLLGVPLVIGELALGRRGGLNAVHTMREVALSEGRSGAWVAIGWLSILVPLLGITYYSIVAGWSLNYMLLAAQGTFRGITAEGSQELFGALLAAPLRLMFWHGLFIAIVVTIIAAGVRRGLEWASKLMMPGLLVLLVLLVIWAAVVGDFRQGMAFLFSADFSALTLDGVLMALGQALFSLAIGVGMLITYGAYVPKDVSLTRAGIIIAGADSLVALLAGMAIFPVVFAVGLEANSGPGLIFETLPVAFAEMPGGVVLGTLFFVMLSLAAITTGFGMIEPAVAWLSRNTAMSRPLATVLIGLLTWLAGLIFVLSFNVWGDVRLLGGIFTEMGLFQLVDFLVANLLLPVNALLLSVFIGYFWPLRSAASETGLSGTPLRLWRALLWLAPALILLVLWGLLRDFL